MELLTRNEGKFDKSSTWIPVLNSWTASRDFDILAPYRFRTWLKEHNDARKQQANMEATAAESDDAEHKEGDR